MTTISSISNSFVRYSVPSDIKVADLNENGQHDKAQLAEIIEKGENIANHVADITINNSHLIKQVLTNDQLAGVNLNSAIEDAKMFSNMGAKYGEDLGSLESLAATAPESPAYSEASDHLKMVQKLVTSPTNQPIAPQTPLFGFELDPKLSVFAQLMLTYSQLFNQSQQYLYNKLTDANHNSQASSSMNQIDRFYKDIKDLHDSDTYKDKSITEIIQDAQQNPTSAAGLKLASYAAPTDNGNPPLMSYFPNPVTSDADVVDALNRQRHFVNSQCLSVGAGADALLQDLDANNPSDTVSSSKINDLVTQTHTRADATSTALSQMKTDLQATIQMLQQQTEVIAGYLKQVPAEYGQTLRA